MKNEAFADGMKNHSEMSQKCSRSNVRKTDSSAMGVRT